MHEGSFPESTWDARDASKVLPELLPPMMHMNIVERKRVNNARIKERREMSHRSAIEHEEIMKTVHRGYEAFHQLPEGPSPPVCFELIGRNSRLGQVHGNDQGNKVRVDGEEDDHVQVR